MDVNGVSSSNVSSVSGNRSAGRTSSRSDQVSGTIKGIKTNDTPAAVYEKSEAVKGAATNPELAAKLKADTQNRLTQMQNLVSDMFTKQGKAFSTADEMWKMLASGDFTVDEKTAKEAQDAISEDGYWGVSQTSQRIFDFAVSLSGGDSEKMDKMMEAFKKGFDQATKTWGKSLPDISSKTYDSVLKKFEDYKNNTTSNAEA